MEERRERPPAPEMGAAPEVISFRSRSGRNGRRLPQSHQVERRKLPVLVRIKELPVVVEEPPESVLGLVPPPQTPEPAREAINAEEANEDIRELQKEELDAEVVNMLKVIETRRMELAAILEERMAIRADEEEEEVPEEKHQESKQNKEPKTIKEEQPAPRTTRSTTRTLLETAEKYHPQQAFQYSRALRSNSAAANVAVSFISPNEALGLSYALATVSIVDPKTYKEAMASESSEGWRAAVKKEIDSLMELNVFEECELPAGHRALPTKIVFKTKVTNEGAVERLKARLVAKGFAQLPATVGPTTYAPVMSYKSLRALLSIVARYDMELYACDVPTAFLKADVKEEIYVQPPEYNKNDPAHNRVWRLEKALYGIKQAPYAWNAEINSAIMGLGYNRCITDPCVYVRNSKTGHPLLIPLFVDDMFPICMTEDKKELWEDMTVLFKKYKIPPMESATKVLGMQIVRDRERRLLTVSQGQYIRAMLADYEMSDCKIASTPERVIGAVNPQRMTEEQQRRSDDREKKWCENGEYPHFGSLVGAIMYAANATRPDIVHAAGMLARKLKSVEKEDWIAAKRVLRYLAGTVDVGITYGASDEHSDAELGPVYCDSDWAGCRLTYKSTSGYLLKMNGGPVVWGSRKQRTQATSSAEAEYYAMGLATQEVLAMRNFLSEIGLTQELPTSIRCDNQPAIHAAYHGPVRMRHIELRHHFLRTHLDVNITVDWVASEMQLADLLTKALGPGLFEKVRGWIMQ